MYEFFFRNIRPNTLTAEILAIIDRRIDKKPEPAAEVTSGTFVYGDRTDSGSSVGVSDFLSLTDTPAAYTGAAFEFVMVYTDEDKLEFNTPLLALNESLSVTNDDRGGSWPCPATLIFDNDGKAVVT